MIIAKVIARARQLYFEKATLRFNHGTKDHPEPYAYNFVDAAEEISRTIDLIELQKVTTEILQHHSAVEVEREEAYLITEQKNETYEDFVRAILAAFLSRQLREDEAVQSEQQLHDAECET